MASEPLSRHNLAKNVRVATCKSAPKPPFFSTTLTSRPLSPQRCANVTPLFVEAYLVDPAGGENDEKHRAFRAISTSQNCLLSHICAVTSGRLWFFKNPSGFETLRSHLAKLSGYKKHIHAGRMRCPRLKNIKNWRKPAFSCIFHYFPR